MKATAVIKAICWTLVGAILVVVLVGVIGAKSFFRAPWSWNWDRDSSNSSYHDEKWGDYNRIGSGDYQQSGTEFADADVNRISIDWLSGDIKVKYVEGNQIKVTEEGNEQLTEDRVLRYRLENGQLTIRFSKYDDFNSSLFRNLSKSLTVEVPKSLSALEIETVSSDVDVTGLTVGTLDVETLSGEFTTSGVTASQLLFESVSGSKDLSGAFEKIDGESVSGSTRITSSVCPSTIDLDTVSGSIKILIPENDGFRVSKSSVSGSLNSDFDGSIQKDGMTYKNGGARFNIDSVSGSVTINRLDGSALV